MMNIKETFLRLTSKTYPHGFEDELVSFLPKDNFRDEHGNYYVEIGKSRTAFTCHLDTCCRDQVDVVHVVDGDTIKTDGKSILGADDKAGMTVLLYMMEKNIPGLYCFFIGEEVGCIGSGLASKDDWFKNYDRMVSFDRRGTNSVITFQSSRRSCSDEFGKELAKRLNKHGMRYEIDDTGVYTDSAEFTDVIPECTNLSVGYCNEHRHNEMQSIGHLIRLANAAVKIDWETLPVKRNPKVVDYKSYSAYSYTPSRYDYGNVGTSWDRSEKHKRKRNRDRNQTKGWSIDEWYDQSHPNKSTYVVPKKEIDKYDGFPVKSNRQSAFPKGKTYYNSLDNEIDDFFDSETRSPAYYEALKQIIYDDRISMRDWDRLKDQYLDMSNPSDVEFYHAMKDSLS